MLFRLRNGAEAAMIVVMLIHLGESITGIMLDRDQYAILIMLGSVIAAAGLEPIKHENPS